MAVNYTPGQLRNAIGIGQETYRHWKKALEPLRRQAGHSPCFTAGDLLATAIVKILVVGYGVRVSTLSAVAATVFEECNVRPWPTLERSRLVLDLADPNVLVQPEGSTLTLESPAVVVPLRPVIEKLGRALLAGDGDGQEMLRFPPVAQPTASLHRRVGSA